MDFSLWTEVEISHGCAVVPHHDFVKTFFIICNFWWGLGLFCLRNGLVLIVHLFFPNPLHKKNKKLNKEVIRSCCRNISGPK